MSFEIIQASTHDKIHRRDQSHKLFHVFLPSLEVLSFRDHGECHKFQSSRMCRRKGTWRTVHKNEEKSSQQVGESLVETRTKIWLLVLRTRSLRRSVCRKGSWETICPKEDPSCDSDQRLCTISFSAAFEISSTFGQSWTCKHSRLRWEREGNTIRSDQEEAWFQVCLTWEARSSSKLSMQLWSIRSRELLTRRKWNSWLRCHRCWIWRRGFLGLHKTDRWWLMKRFVGNWWLVHPSIRWLHLKSNISSNRTPLWDF